MSLRAIVLALVCTVWFAHSQDLFLESKVVAVGGEQTPWVNRTWSTDKCIPDFQCAVHHDKAATHCCSGKRFFEAYALKKCSAQTQCSICQKLVPLIQQALASKGTCAAVDVTGDALCLALNLEDFDILGVGCAVIVDGACAAIETAIKIGTKVPLATFVCDQTLGLCGGGDTGHSAHMCGCLGKHECAAPLYFAEQCCSGKASFDIHCRIKHGHYNSPTFFGCH